MQKDLNDKEEKIRILEAKNETLRQTADTKTDEIENLKQKVLMLEQEVCTEGLLKLCTSASLHSYQVKQMRKRNYWMRKKSYWQTLAYMVGCVREALRGLLPTTGVDATLKLKRDAN